MTAHEHDFVHLGLQWWDDGQPRPGSGATTIRYAHAFYCRRCLERSYQRAALDHDSYQKVRHDASPIIAADKKQAESAA